MVWYIVLGIAFATIALAELADKTQLVTISQACRYPYAPVLAGSALALVVVTAIGVVIGTFLNWLLPVRWLNLVAGLLFLFFGALMLFTWLRDRGTREEAECAVDEEPECEISNTRIFASTFALVALAELGDKTQLAVIALSGKYGSPMAVFVGASLALVLVSSVSVVAGRMIARRFSLQAVQVLAAALFIALGVIFLIPEVPGL
jgi:putative Ca2+/H+ antiporter (TMEM165/GDT1 family)